MRLMSSNVAGSIAVATDSEDTIELNGIEKIEGDFIAADNMNLRTLASDALVEVTGTVEFSNLQILANITLPRWDSAGIVILDRIPTPTYTDFQQQGQQISELYIRNTELVYFTGVSGVSLAGAQLDALEIVDNPYLQLVVFKAGNVTGQCKITGNGDDLDLQLPNLTYAYSLEISNASKIALPMLSSVNDGLQVSLSDVSEISLPELTYVGGDLLVSNNPNLETLDLQALVNVRGTLEISENESLKLADELPSLSAVRGDLNMTGAFESINLPALGYVRNDIVINSTGPLNCADVPSSPAQGRYSCTSSASSTMADPSSNDNDRDGDTESDGSTTQSGGLSVGAKVGIALGAVAVAALIAALCFLLWKWQRRQRHATNSQSYDAPEAALPWQAPGFVERKAVSRGMAERGLGLEKSTSVQHSGLEGRPEMFSSRDSPAAHELDGSWTHQDGR